MSKQLKIQITVSEEELALLNKTAEIFKTRVSTFAKNILMQEVKELSANYVNNKPRVKVKDLIENIYIYEMLFLDVPCKYIGRDKEGFFGFIDMKGLDTWVDMSSMELYKGELYFIDIWYNTGK